MRAVIHALAQAFAQLTDRAVLMVLLKSVLATVLAFVALGIGLYFALVWALGSWAGESSGLAGAAAAVLVFLAVNAWLLGRELTDMAWLRHCGARDAQNPVSRSERLLLGGAITGIMLVPGLNLIAPVLGAAAGTHLTMRSLPSVKEPCNA